MTQMTRARVVTQMTRARAVPSNMSEEKLHMKAGLVKVHHIVLGLESSIRLTS